MKNFKLSDWAIKNNIFKKDVLLLRKSINNKWKLIIAGTEIDKGHKDCFLCREFLKDSCVSCVVFKKTDHSKCKETPITKWIKHQKRVHEKKNLPYKIECSTCKKIAQDVINFAEKLYKELIQ